MIRSINFICHNIVMFTVLYALYNVLELHKYILQLWTKPHKTTEPWYFFYTISILIIIFPTWDVMIKSKLSRLFHTSVNYISFWKRLPLHYCHASKDNNQGPIQYNFLNFVFIFNYTRRAYTIHDNKKKISHYCVFDH